MDNEASEHMAAEQSNGNLTTIESTGRSTDYVVTLCVGGSSYTTTLGTLTAVPRSYLAILFGDQSLWRPSSTLPGSNTPFIDRDGELFRFALAYLRSVRDCAQQQQPLLLPDNPIQLQQLKAEADFYGLPGLATICSLARGGTHRTGAWGRLAALRQQQQQENTAEQCPHPELQQQWLVGHHRVQQGAQQQQHQHQQQQQQRSAPTGPPVSEADVLLDLPTQLQASSSRVSLAAAMLHAQQVRSTQQQQWVQDPVLQQCADIVMRHLVQLPLAAQQPDLVAALANAEPGVKLELRFAYYPVGDTRIDLQCLILPPNAHQATAIAAAAAAVGAGVAGRTSPSPNTSPRDSRQPYRRSTISTEMPAAVADGGGFGSFSNGTVTGSSSGRAFSGPLSPEAAGVAAVAAAAAATAAVKSYTGAAVMPGPGWGSVTMYHRYTIKESSDSFVLTTQSPGEAQDRQQVPHADFKPELKRYSALHKLCVQQCPRSSVAGLLWLLEDAGFSSVALSTSLDTCFVGSNSFSGFTSIITCDL